mgnify:CR=1 FL=1
MFIRPYTREKNGRRYAYWALVESYRTARGPRQRTVAYVGQLGEGGRLGVKRAAEGKGQQTESQLQFWDDDTPPAEWKSPLTAFQAAYEHEQKVTGLINELVELALTEHDHASSIFLQWFVSEQVEEEENVSGVLEQLRLMGEAKGGLFMIDRELAKRSPANKSGESE